MKSLANFIYVIIFTLLIIYSGMAQTAPVVYVAGDGTGDFNCDGTSDQVEINQALDFVATHAAYTTVYLKGNYTYNIDDPVLISSNTILTGDSSATIKLIDNAGWWTTDKPLVTQTGRTAWDAYGDPSESVSDIEIYGFTIDGGLQQEPNGNGYYNLIHFTYPVNIRIHDMHLINGNNDAVRLSASGQQFFSASRVYHNYFYQSGHDAIGFVNLIKCHAYENRIIKTRTNSGIRASHSDSIYFHHNIIGNSLSASAGGFAGIQIQNKYENRAFTYGEIYENIIYGKPEGIHAGTTDNNAIYPTGTMKNLYIHHNRIYQTKNATSPSGTQLTGGIVISGFHNTLIEHNIIDGSETDGIVYRGNAGGNGGNETIVRNNIIINNNGYGISNESPAVHNFVSGYNLVYNNQTGNYNNLTSNNDVNADPLFGETHTASGQWHHIVACYDNSNDSMKIYIDGEEKASKNMNGNFGSIGNNTYNLVLGMYLGYFWYNGLMDEMGLWNRAITTTEVNSLYNNGIPVNITGSLLTGLQGYYNMDNNWNDNSNNANNALSATAGFSTNAIGGTHAGLFDGTDDSVTFPDSFSTQNGISISIWVKRNTITESIQTLVNKGKQTHNDHIWLYFKGESLIFEIGNGNIRKSLEAYIINPEDIDYHVQSEYGRWKDGNWVIDNNTSPCVDAGDPSSDFFNEPNPNGNLANIGVYGNTAEASKSAISALHETSIKPIKIYPNPTKGKLYFSKELRGKYYEIISITGQLIQQGNTGMNIDISKISKGIYFLKIGKQGQIIKLIKN